MQKEKRNITIQQGIIPEFISGSSTHAVTQETTKQQALKTLNQVQGLTNFKPQYQNVGQALPDNKIKGHSRKSLSGIYNACSSARETQTTCVEDPRTLRAANSSGMTAHFNNIPSSVLTGQLPPHGEVANFNSPSTWRERAECVSTGVRGYRSGFTLIELLVVVLIIGILAAVALPQYQKAVNKSRASTALSMLKAIHYAQEVHRLETGEYATDLSELSIEIPADVQAIRWAGFNSNLPNKYMFSCNSTGDNCNASASNANLPSFEYHTDGKLYCIYTITTKSVAVEQICQSFGGIYSHTYRNAEYDIEARYYRI